MGALTITVPVLLAGGLRASQGWHLLRSRRRIADPWLLWGADARPAAELLAWRAAELTDVRSRKILARGLRRLRGEAEGRLVPGALPLNRLEIRSQIGLLRALESRLADLSRPVSPRGVLLVEQLLTQPGSPLYSHERSDQLAQQLSEACAALDPIPGSAKMDFPPSLYIGFGADRFLLHAHRAGRAASN
jgi:hypothetical protein